MSLSGRRLLRHAILLVGNMSRRQQQSRTAIPSWPLIFPEPTSLTGIKSILDALAPPIGSGGLEYV
jgi:hypothetical protein